MKQAQVHEIRAFNRFYTSMLGLLDKYLLKSNYTLLEVRILFEIYNHRDITASEITAQFRLDKGYLSRTLKHLEKKKLVTKRPSPKDRRNSQLVLTLLGKKEFESLNRAADDQIKRMLRQLSGRESAALLNSMNSIKKILTKLQV